MKELITEMRGVVERETARAMATHGPRYASMHEGYGVLAEEIWEAEHEVSTIRRVQAALLPGLHTDNAQSIRDTLEYLQETAILAACECAQVAAVATKMLDSLPSLPPLTRAEVMGAERQYQAAQNPYRPCARDFADPMGGAEE